MKDLPFPEATSCYLAGQVPEITHAESDFPLQSLVLMKRDCRTKQETGKPKLERKAKCPQMSVRAWLQGHWPQ